MLPHLTGPDLIPDNLYAGQSDLSGEGGLGLSQPLLQVYQQGLVSLDLADSLPSLHHDPLNLVGQGLSLGVQGHQLGPAAGQRGGQTFEVDITGTGGGLESSLQADGILLQVFYAFQSKLEGERK